MLVALGYNVRQIAQEHSYVPYMWQRISNPDLLIFLDVSFEKTLVRKPLNWTRKEYQTQQNRLSHARQHADLLINTSDLDPGQVLQTILVFLMTVNE